MAVSSIPSTQRATNPGRGPRWLTTHLAIATLAFTVAACAPNSSDADASPARSTTIEWTVVERYPHDREAFTQGLLVQGNTIYESTGLRGRSTVRIVDLATGAIRKQVALPDDLFGEGLARVGDRLIQLTWTKGVAREYALPDLDLVKEHAYQGQGWGLCFDGRQLVMSDGSNRLYLRDPETFEVTRTIEVTENGSPLSRLNELECVRGHIYANVWGTWRIVQINPKSGHVEASMDASDLLSVMEKQALAREAVLNGIAYDESTETFLLTGKLWPRIHRVRFIHGNSR